MNEPHDDNRTGPMSSAPGDSLDAGLAAGFGQRPDGPRSGLGASQRPVVLRPAEGESDHVVKPRSDAMPPPGQEGDRYQLQGEIARGGMGAVLRGRDVDLGRDLAVKVLLEKYVDRPEVARRFLEEAQVGAQLQHPNVVPVYDIGHFGARPFFTMKLVKGHTLAAQLAERERPTEDRPRLLGIALKVSEAMAYAHAKGVIHRDLKPANVMVGAFGEVQVMDWGLAKVLAEGGVADEERAARQHQDDGTQIRTARSGTAGGHGTDTEAGSLLGTPAYMPPEQALGDVARLDRRADVFGLGAILCEVLTGKPPYTGRSFEEVRRKAANGDLADATARLDACGADPELIALTKRCLAPEANDRPRDAQAVADDLSAYLNGVQERLQVAQRERAVAVAREAEQRKRRKVQLALAAAVVALLLGGGAFAWWRNEQAHLVRQRDARNAEAVAALLGQCEDALRAGDAAKAAVALDAARKRSAEGGAEGLADRLGRLDADLTVARDLDEVDRFRWTPAERHLPGNEAVAARARAALTRFGADPDAGSVDEAAARVSASVVRERIVTALDRWLLWPERKAAVRAFLSRVDSDPYRDAVRDAVLAGDRARFAQLLEQKAALEQPPGFVALMGEDLRIPVERRRRLLGAAVCRRPGDLWLIMALADSYPNDDPDGAAERLRWVQAAAAVAPTNPATLVNLGVALHEHGQLDEAAECYRKAIEYGPKVAEAHNNLAAVLLRQRRLDDAIACCRKAIELHPTFAEAHCNLGLALKDKGRLAEAIENCSKAVEFRPDLPRPHNNLGVVLRANGQLDRAIECFRKALKLDPKLVAAHTNLAAALKDRGHADRAVASYNRALELDPKNAGVHSDLGLALHEMGQVEKALACFRKALELDPKLAAAHVNLGMALFGKAQVDDAIRCFNRALELDPTNATAHANLGSALSEKGQLPRAIAHVKKAVKLAPKFAGAHSILGNLLSANGQVEEAIASYKRAIKLAPKYATTYANLANLLRGQGQVDEAIAHYRKAIRLNPKLAGAYSGMGFALSGNGQVDEAIVNYREALKLNPDHATTYCNLGAALARKGRFAESLAAYRRCHELGSKRPGWDSPSADWVRRAEAKVAMEAKLPAFLQGEFRPDDNTDRLPLAAVCQARKRPHAAAGLYAAAFAADPKPADDLEWEYRHHAACCAVLAAAGQGEDAAKLDDPERARLRRQALDWLRADLALRTRQLESGRPAHRVAVLLALRNWQKDPDLAGVRDKAALARLPAEERKAFAQLWADVAATLQKAERQTR